MATFDVNIEAIKNKDDFVNNRISRDLKKHNWLVEKLLQEKLIAKLDTVAPSEKTQKTIKSSSTLKQSKLKQNKAPQTKEEEPTAEERLKPHRYNLKEDKEQSLGVCLEIAKVIYEKLLRKDKHDKKRTCYEKNKIRTKHVKRPTDISSLGTVDDLLNNVFKSKDKTSTQHINVKTNKREIANKISDKNEVTYPGLSQSLSVDKNCMKRKLQKKVKRKEITKINTLNITVGDSITCHLPSEKKLNNNECKENTSLNDKVTEKLHGYSNIIQKQESSQNPLYVYENFKCKVRKDIFEEKKSKTYSVEAQTESVPIITSEEQDILFFLKSNKLDKVNLEILLKSSCKRNCLITKQVEAKNSSKVINNPNVLLEAFLTFCDEYKKKTDELGEKISVLFASIKEKETLEISNLAKSIEKELENMTQESQGLSQGFDQLLESQQVAEQQNVMSTDTQQGPYRNHSCQFLPCQQNLAYQEQDNNNQQIQVYQQQNPIYQHQLTTKHQLQNCQPASSLLQLLQSPQPIDVPYHIQRQNNSRQLSSCQGRQFRRQTPYQRDCRQTAPINQYPRVEQNAASMTNNRLSCSALTSHLPVQGLPTQTSQFHTQPSQYITPAQNPNWIYLQ